MHGKTCCLIGSRGCRSPQLPMRARHANTEKEACMAEAATDHPQLPAAHGRRAWPEADKHS